VEQDGIFIHFLVQNINDVTPIIKNKRLIIIKQLLKIKDIKLMVQGYSK
jgi:hypothetical protein